MPIAVRCVSYIDGDGTLHPTRYAQYSRSVFSVPRCQRVNEFTIETLEESVKYKEILARAHRK